jgi:flagellar motor protein MotB
VAATTPSQNGSLEETMTKKHWENLTEADDLAAVGVPRHRGRGWKILAGLLLIGAASFVIGYYLPLYRAHALLRNEYKTKSTEASTFRQQLVDTVATLKQTTEELSKLQSEAAKQQKGTEALAMRSEQLEHRLQAPLKKFLGKGRLGVERLHDKLRITLPAPAMVAATGGELTDFGKKALCALGASIKDSNVQLSIQGLGVSPSEKSASAWQLAATRAGNAAQWMSKTCGVDATRIEVVVRSATQTTETATLAVEVTPGS